ncbi:MAG: patatin-like phospholipase family protein [Clostridia bacterium]|nr:patatin-like phospholipase family protein [Clostridia bacterium]
MAKKLGLVLGSGGARGVAHVGFVKALEEAGIRPQCISGSSAGSIVGACMATGMTADEIMEEIRNLKVSEVLFGVPNFNRSGLFSTRGIHRKLGSFFKRKRIYDLDIDFCCVATNLAKGEEKVFSGRSFVVPAVVASSCIPALFEPEVIGGVQYVDGGVVSRLPIEAIKMFEPEVIVAVDVFAEGSEVTEYPNALSVLSRAVDIMDRNYTKAKTKEENPDLLVLPDLGNMTQYTFKDLDFAYEQGYKAGKESIDEIKRLIGE